MSGQFLLAGFHDLMDPWQIDSVGYGGFRLVAGGFVSGQAKVAQRNLSHAGTGSSGPSSKVQLSSFLHKPERLTGLAVVRTYTLWGEMAYQLGGATAYEEVRKSDEQRTAPSTQPWEKMIGDEPALLMIDEIGQYLRVSGGVQVGRKTLAGQTVAFLMSLMKFAAESKGVVLVYTLADSGDAFGKESDQLRQALSALCERVAQSALDAFMGAADAASPIWGSCRSPRAIVPGKAGVRTGLKSNCRTARGICRSCN